MTPQQEERICAMVAANNALRLREIQRTVVEDDTIFGNIVSISISATDRVLRRNKMSMKQLYKVPFERNSDRVKELRHQYVQRILELEAREPRLYILTKRDSISQKADGVDEITLMSQANEEEILQCVQQS